MNKSPLIFQTAKLFVVFFLLTFQAFAQPGTPFGRSYDVVLQVVVGSDEAQNAELPRELSAISRQLKSRFEFRGYRLTSTLLGRVGESGNFENKSVTNFVDKDSIPGMPVFFDWTIANFSGLPEANAKSGFHVQSFRFGARVPVRLAGRPDAAANYENIGLSFSRLGFPASTPTLLGTLSLPQTAGTMFLILTVKQAEL